MRMTIPKSQGKQPFYDARKSSWGDIFPHEPKNPPQERFAATSARPMRGRASGRSSDGVGAKRRDYTDLAKELKGRKNKLREDRRLRDV